MGLAELLNTPEMRQRAQELQDERRAKFGGQLPNTPAHVNFRFGEARETAVRAQLTTQPQDDPIYAQLAEAYFLQGRFGEAAATCPPGPERNLYELKADAAKSLGVKRCACPDVIRVPDGSAMGREEKTTLPIDEVFDGEKTILITQCRLCHTFSAQVGSVMPAILEKHSAGASET